MELVSKLPFIVLLVYFYFLETKTAFSFAVNSTKYAGVLNATVKDELYTYFDTYRIIKAFNALESNVFKSLNLLKVYTHGNKLLEDDSLIYELDTSKPFGQNRVQNQSICVNDTAWLILGFLNGDNWAIQFFDATGKPGPSLTLGQLNFVGNYDQCRSATAPPGSSPNGDGESGHGFHGGYFQVALGTPSVPIPIQIGVCLPDTCSEEEIASIGRELIEAANVSLSLISVHHLTNATEMTCATIIAIVITCFIGLIVISGTVFDLLFVQLPLRHETIPDDHNGTGDSQDHFTVSERKPILDVRGENQGIRNVCNASHPNRTATQILTAFSVYSNAKKILNTSQPPGSIESIHGIRFFSITWVIMAHTYAFANPYAANPASGNSKFMNRWTFDVVANSFVCVDTFFTLSGLLTSYVTIGQILKKGLRFQWPLFYFHRFWRLTPPYMFVILVYLGFQQYFIQGPLRNYEQPIDKSACEKHWWTNLLYINNIIYSTQGEICLGHSWYMSNDMQFFILSPLMMIPLYFHRLAGLCVCVAFILASWITTGVLSTLKEWPPAGPNLKLALRGEQNDGWLNDYYTKPWCRIGPFVIGILAGYILNIFKDRQFYMKRWIAVLGWIVAGGSGLAIVYGLRGDITGDEPSSVGTSALYNTVARSVWGACVSWVIIACTAGYGGPVNKLLSWAPFVVLGRLSYMVYLTHVPIIFIFYQNLDQLFYANDTTMVVNFLGLVVASNLVAFALMLVMESPFIGLEKVILRKDKQ